MNRGAWRATVHGVSKSRPNMHHNNWVYSYYYVNSPNCSPRCLFGNFAYTEIERLEKDIQKHPSLDRVIIGRDPLFSSRATIF